MIRRGSPLISVVSADPDYRQFRFSVGAPEAETKFKQAVYNAQQTSHNAMKYPSLYVRFVGSMRAYFILTFPRLSTDLASRIGIR